MAASGSRRRSTAATAFSAPLRAAPGRDRRQPRTCQTRTPRRAHTPRAAATLSQARDAIADLLFLVIVQGLVIRFGRVVLGVFAGHLTAKEQEFHDGRRRAGTATVPETPSARPA